MKFPKWPSEFQTIHLIFRRIAQYATSMSRSDARTRNGWHQSDYGTRNSGSNTSTHNRFNQNTGPISQYGQFVIDCTVSSHLIKIQRQAHFVWFLLISFGKIGEEIQNIAIAIQATVQLTLTFRFERVIDVKMSSFHLFELNRARCWNRWIECHFRAVVLFVQFER